ncbi:hypothetical protein GCM10009630_31630 [Kribbella jejuensis]|uniref:Phosphotransferase family enzyme n=1 Tax=Kribbella jejuensis TaxID=236068 RepID=A0A542DTS1_9ACTN|nr:phosphotransferase [Kribbella jejuensis]TQJ06487.1 phosphotransferase family enzyme [Kribbella jejuensis]
MDFEAVARAEVANAQARPVRIVDGVVTRPAGSNAETVQGFLRFLRGRGLECVPEPLGFGDGVEMLRFIPGDSGGDAWRHQHTDEGLASAARLLRRIHDESQAWNSPADDLVYCHGDPGPWNFVWKDNSAVGLIDWDYLYRGPRLDDIAYALHWFVPLRSDELALRWHHFPEVPDRRHRIKVFLDAYGDLPKFDVVGVVTGRMEATRDLVRRLAHEGQEPQRTWVHDGALEREDEEIAWVRQNRTLFT